jgi:hypothetical protein
MAADLVYCARCVVDSVNTTYIAIAFRLFVLSLAKHAKRRFVALSSRRFIASESRQTARCLAACYRDVVLSLSLYIYKKPFHQYSPSHVTLRHHAAHDNAPFVVHRKRQDDETKVRQTTCHALSCCR